MTPEQINIAIAEFCGWEMELCVSPLDKTTSLRLWKSPSHLRLQASIPNYYGDLNAIHEAEIHIIKTGQWENYKTWLWMVHTKSTSLVEAVTKEIRGDDVIHADAPQRCEALLRTTGKWEEKQ